MRLRRVAAALEAGASLPADDAAWLARRIERYLAEAHKGMTLDRALGLVPAPGQRPWWKTAALRKRDAILRKIYKARFAGLGIADAAREIARLYPRRPGASPAHPLADAIDTGLPLPSARRLRT